MLNAGPHSKAVSENACVQTCMLPPPDCGFTGLPSLLPDLEYCKVFKATPTQQNHAILHQRPVIMSQSTWQCSPRWQ